MKKILITIIVTLVTTLTFAQEGDRTFLRGQVIYRDNYVQNENVVNITTQKATITDENGEFLIKVKVGDELVFSAVNYKIKSVIITEEILKNKRLVVEVKEKVTELSEVVVGPENQQAFLKLKNEEFKRFDYEEDSSSEIENTALNTTERGFKNGLNFVNIYKALFKSKKDEEEERSIRMSEVLRQVYEDDFFVYNLKIPQEKIGEFLVFCDTKMPARSLLKKDNEFELIEFLVNQSKAYLKILDEKN